MRESLFKLTPQQKFEAEHGNLVISWFKGKGVAMPPKITGDETNDEKWLKEL